MSVKNFIGFSGHGGQIRTNLLLATLVSAVVFVLFSFPLAALLTRQVVEQREKDRLTISRVNYERLRRSFEGKNGDLSESSIATFLNYVLVNTFPDDDTFLIGFVGDRFFDATPSALPGPVHSDSEVLKGLARSDIGDQGVIPADNPNVGSILYQSIPIVTGSKRLGSFLILITTAGEIKESEELVMLLQRWFLFLYFLSLLVAWLFSFRITKPLQQMAAAMDEISATNLSTRLEVKGNDELARMGVKFNEMLNRIESLVKAQREFVQDISHELRTPITVIRGHTELIPLDSAEELPKTIRIILDEVDRMARIVSELTVLARSERPEFLNLGTFQLLPFLEELLAKAEKLAPREWALCCSGDTLITADSQLLTQGMMNLLLNACQHTISGQKITLGGDLQQDGILRLWVSDEGEGIEPALQGKVFDRFIRGSTQGRDRQGSGLGLAIVSAIVNAHQGEIALVSVLGSGSTFTILIPQQPKGIQSPLSTNWSEAVTAKPIHGRKDHHP